MTPDERKRLMGHWSTVDLALKAKHYELERTRKALKEMTEAAYMLTCAMALPGRDLSVDEAKFKLMALVQKQISEG